MGELSEDVYNGACCQLCGCYFIERHGHPVVCEDCWEELEEEDFEIFTKSGYPTI